MKRASAVAAAGGMALALVLVPGIASAAGRPATVYVSPTGHSGAAGTSCQSAVYSVINDAIGAVDEGGTVVVCKGTYAHSAIVDKTLTLLGRPGAVIDAAGQESGIQVHANEVTVRGFTVEHATVGIRVTSGDYARIVSNDSHNNVHTGIYLMNGTSRSYVADNTVSGNPINGIELGRTSYARMIHNHVTGNSTHMMGAGIAVDGSYAAEVVNNVVDDNNNGGIGLDNAAGPSDYCTVTGNQVRGNYISGIGLFGFAQVAGQYAVEHNIISDNTVTRNGLGINGQGEPGISLISYFPNELNGGSVSVADNTVTGNRISGNGGPGIALHAYADESLNEYQDMDGNVITGNRIGTNNLVGDNTVANLPGAPDSLTVDQTAGVLIASSTPLTIDVSANTIYSNYYGIWNSAQVTVAGTSYFGHVTEPMFTYTGG